MVDSILLVPRALWDTSITFANQYKSDEKISKEIFLLAVVKCEVSCHCNLYDNIIFMWYQGVRNYMK